MAETYCLPSKLDLSAATPLANDLMKHVQDDLILDAGEVSQIGALCAQVIGSAAISLRANNHSLSIVNMPDRIVEQLHHIGLTPELLTEASL